MPRTPDVAIESAKAKWSLIAKRIARFEEDRKTLWDMIRQRDETIKRQADRIEYLAPWRETSWEWVYWPLRRKEIWELAISAPQDSRERKVYGRKVRTCAHARVGERHVYVRQFQGKSGRWYFRISKGKKCG